jgi:hypothetical protein
MLEAVSFTKWCELSMNSDLLTSFGRMFPDCSLTDLDGTSSRFSMPWTESGIVEHGQLLMLGGLVLHSNDAAFSECSLAEILEPQAAPKYFLSARAARGILRRAAKRQRTLPPALEAALTELASTLPEEGEKTTAT